MMYRLWNTPFGVVTAKPSPRFRLRLTVLEALSDVAGGTTKANSAILHGGYDPEPDTRMARLKRLSVW